MSATEDDVLRVAKLARIDIGPAELANVQKKFSAILDHFKFLEEADTHAVEPLFHAAEKMELRPDQAKAPIARDSLLANAPDHINNCFRIPKVVGEAE